MGRWSPDVAAELSRLITPINDVLAAAGLKPGSWAGPFTRGDLLAAMGREGIAFWGWDREQWERAVAMSNVNVRQLVIAVAYLLCGFDDLHWGIGGFHWTRTLSELDGRVLRATPPHGRSASLIADRAGCLRRRAEHAPAPARPRPRPGRRLPPAARVDPHPPRRRRPGVRAMTSWRETYGPVARERDLHDTRPTPSRP